MQNINSVTVTGNLTKDPELRTTPSGTSVCQLRLAVNGRTKQNDEWVDKPNYFDVTVWGRHGETCSEHLAKGRPVAVQGRLDWREWEATDGSKRQAVQIVADTVQFLGTGQAISDKPEPSSDVPADTSDLGDAAAGSDADIPF